MGDLDDQLRRLAERRADRTPVTTAPDVMVVPAPRRRRWAYAAVAAAVIAVAGFGVAALVSDNDPDVQASDDQTDVQHIVLDEFGIEFDIPADWESQDYGEPTIGWGTDAGHQGGWVAFDLRPTPTATATNILQANGFPDYNAYTADDIEVDGQPGTSNVGERGKWIVVSAPASSVGDEGLVVHVFGTIEHIDAILDSIRWLPAEAPDAPVETTTVDAIDFGVRIEIPAHWKPIEVGRTWGGDDGWVAVDVLPTADVTALVESLGVTENDVDISATTVMGIPATLVTTREAVELDFGTFRVSGAVVATPAPVTQHDQTWDQIVIGGDTEHLPGILASAVWIDPTEPAPSSPGERRDVAAPDPAVTYDLVSGTSEGVEFRDLANNRIDRMPIGPTNLAFFVGGFVVHEAADGSSAPPITVWHEAGSYVIDLGAGFRQTQLRDVALVDGVPMALVTKQTGANIEDWVNDLFLVDLPTGDVERLAAAGGWEVGTDDVRFADGAIAMAVGGIDAQWVEVIDYDGNRLWQTEPSTEDPSRLHTRFDIVTRWEAEWSGDLTPVLHTVSLDLLNGDEIGRETFQLSVEDGTEFADGWCRWAIAYQDMACGQSTGAPLYVDLWTNTIHTGPAPGLTEGYPTTVDREVRSTFLERHPCGRQGGTGPGDVLFSQEVELDNGLTLTVWVWIEWQSAEEGRVMIQGVLPDWRSPRIDLGAYVEDDIHELSVTPIEHGTPLAERGLLTVFMPDGLAIPGTPTGGLLVIDFDGCELVVTSAGVVN
ncbi:MAG: hypothetical protein DHS20C19_12100 [Acidimicrobiales bacterium]|nr:MAG: hypothetical protein DHS20C19_12100 [Acidimicrobiales bacterium]